MVTKKTKSNFDVGNYHTAGYGSGFAPGCGLTSASPCGWWCDPTDKDCDSPPYDGSTVTNIGYGYGSGFAVANGSGVGHSAGFGDGSGCTPGNDDCTGNGDVYGEED